MDEEKLKNGAFVPDFEKIEKAFFFGSIHQTKGLEMSLSLWHLFRCEAQKSLTTEHTENTEKNHEASYGWIVNNLGCRFSFSVPSVSSVVSALDF
jgi:hypothetical protein